MGSQKKYKAAAKFYQKAFKINKENVRYLYSAAHYTALAGNKKKAVAMLKEAAHAGYALADNLTKDSALIVLHSDKDWPAVVQEIEYNKQNPNRFYNQELRSQLLAIGKEDQGIRSIYRDSVKKYGFANTHPVIKAIIKKMEFTDSINLIKVVAILEKYDHPRLKDVGMDGCLVIFQVIQHSNLKTQERYLPLLNEALAKGYQFPENITLMEDRIALQKGEKQIYGSQIGGDVVTNTYFVLPLLDPDNVDMRRKKKGLSTLASYIKQWNLIWDVNDYKQKLAQGLIKNNLFQEQKH